MTPAGTGRLLDLAQDAWPADARQGIGLWQAYRLRWRRRRLLLRAIGKRRELTPVVDRTAAIAPGAILCLSTMRNESARLPHFLAANRRIGVGHFLVVDNGSTDGTDRMLADQPDVSVWRTGAGYKASRFGMDWLTWLLMRHGHGHWCLTLDADETLVYPHCDARPLHALTGWLDRQGETAFGAVMLDMYPEGAVGDGGFAPGDDPFDTLRWFDAANYRVTFQSALGNLWIQGGVRERCFFAADPVRAPTLNKVPLVRWNRRQVYVNATHTLLPRRLNRVFADTPARASGVLLHSKFLPEIVAKSAEELTRQQHFARSELYRDYHRALVANPVLHAEGATRYHDWQQLERLGLMTRGGWT